MAFYETKNWWQSKTIWASIATAVLGVLALFDVTPDQSQVNHWIDAAFVLLGAFTAYGRKTATAAVAPTA